MGLGKNQAIGAVPLDIRKKNLFQIIPRSGERNAKRCGKGIPALIEVGGNTTGNWGTLGSHTCDCAQGSVDEVAAVINVSIAPNPSKGVFTVSNIETFNNVQVINSLGQEVYSVANNGQSSIVMDLSNRRGVYFVKLSGKGEAVTRRVIIK